MVVFLQKSEGGKCEDNNNNHQIVCKILHPIFKKNVQVLLKHVVAIQSKSLNDFTRFYFLI